MQLFDTALHEDAYSNNPNHLEIEILDQDKYIKMNNLQEITNPVFFSNEGVPTDDGLLSQTIFGITQKDRSGIFAYINLHGWFLDPSYYKAWFKLDSRIKKIISKEGKWSLSKEGKIIEDPAGKTCL